MVGDPDILEESYHYLYEFIVRDQLTGVKVYRTAYKVHASRSDILFTVQQNLRERVANGNRRPSMSSRPIIANSPRGSL